MEDTGPGAENPAVFAAPVKHSIKISGHMTSISLEPVFWHALRRAARDDGLALSALVAQIDAMRLDAMRAHGQAGDERATPPNLASAIRCWLWQRATAPHVQAENTPRA